MSWQNIFSLRIFLDLTLSLDFQLDSFFLIGFFIANFGQSN